MASVPWSPLVGPRGVRGSGLALAAVALTLPVLAGRPVSDLRPPMVVSFSGRSVPIQGSATLRALLVRENATPKAGRLLSLQGRVLRPDAAPPAFIRNGRPATLDQPLGPGDDVELKDGRDSTEAAVTETYQQASGNPQFVMGEGTVTVRRGVLSGEVETVASGTAPGLLTIALTFDDGPGPATNAILDVLRDRGVKATFFAVGRYAAAHPEIVRRELGDGHAVGVHTWDHLRLAGRAEGVVRDQLLRTRDLLNELGAHVTVHRPPYGSFDATTVAGGSALGLRTVIWSSDPKDWRRPGTKAIVDRVLAQARPGAIVLLHDGGGDRGQTVAALPAIIDGLRARGYAFAVLA
jgi:peptidoglycan/xylan/chitin deacetylase (PgdA/CDA1 family)